MHKSYQEILLIYLSKSNNIEPLNTLEILWAYIAISRLFQYGFRGPIQNFSTLPQKYDQMWLTNSQNINKIPLKSYLYYKITPLNSFLKFYVMGTTERHLFGIAHVKVDFFGVQKMWVTSMLGRFV